MDLNFLRWSIADLWEWLIHVPYLGFISLLLFAVIVITGIVESRRD